MKAIIFNNEKRCGFCYSGAPRFSPKLQPSGRGRVRNLVCPFCNRYYDSETLKEYPLKINK